MLIIGLNVDKDPLDCFASRFKIMKYMFAYSLLACNVNIQASYLW